jgi:hypothetical protein
MAANMCTTSSSLSAEVRTTPVDAALTATSLTSGMEQEEEALAAVYPAPEFIVERMRAAVEGGIQTREGEFDLEASLDRY